MFLAIGANGLSLRLREDLIVPSIELPIVLSSLSLNSHADSIWLDLKYPPCDRELLCRVLLPPIDSGGEAGLVFELIRIHGEYIRSIENEVDVNCINFTTTELSQGLQGSRKRTTCFRTTCFRRRKAGGLTEVNRLLSRG